MSAFREDQHGTTTGYRRGCRCVACRAAMAESGRRHRAEHPEEHAERHSKYYAEHREELAEKHRKYYAAHPEEEAERSRKYSAEHRDEIAEHKRQYRVEHIEERTEYDRKYNAEHREEIAASRLERIYGLIPGEWDVMFAAQGSGCAICGTDDPGSVKGWHTDHDHKTGALRGILCRKHNHGLGNFDDDPELLMAAIEYLAAATL